MSSLHRGGGHGLVIPVCIQLEGKASVVWGMNHTTAAVVYRMLPFRASPIGTTLFSKVVKADARLLSAVMSAGACSALQDLQELVLSLELAAKEAEETWSDDTLACFTQRSSQNVVSFEIANFNGVGVAAEAPRVRAVRVAPANQILGGLLLHQVSA